MHRAEISHAENHIKSILVCADKTSRDDVTSMKKSLRIKIIRQYFSLIAGEKPRTLKSPKYPAGFSSQVNIFILLEVF